MVVVAGRCDAACAPSLSAHLRKVRRETDVVVDLWDVAHISPPVVGVLAEAKQSADAEGWGFALVADPAGPCIEAIEAAGEADTLRPFASRQDARRALQLASP
jgi:anti-anti-sigma regulatory factor